MTPAAWPASADVVVVEGVGGWAATSQLSNAVIASGTLVIDGSAKKVQHPNGGVISELFVKEGQRIASGDIIARLDDTGTRASLAAVTLLDRPYRRLVDDIPLRHVGFTVPDELFAGYGLGLDERWRALPDLHVVVADELPVAIDAA